MFPKGEDPQFFVKGGGAFADRQKSIFDQLDAAEKEQSARNPINTDAPPHVRNHPMEVEPFNSSVRTARRNRIETKQFRGKESIFKRPDSMPPRFKAKQIPDHHKNPEKWTRYSLGDVSQSDMSNTSNTAAAFAFLQEIAARKEAEALEDANARDNSAPISFRRPRSTPQPTFGTALASESVDAEKPSFKSSKLVMPEYVVGLSKPKQRKREVGGGFASTSIATSSNIDGGLLLPFSWSKTESSTESKTSDGEKPATKQSRRRQRKKEMLNSTKCTPLPPQLRHLFMNDEEGGDGKDGGS